MMRHLIFAFFWGAVLAIPHSLRKDNPDERGNHYQGDIVLPINPMDRNGLIDESYRWPNGEIIYSIDGDFTDRQVGIIEQAMQEYSDKTNGCVKFVERGLQVNYVSIVNTDPDGCFSSVGMVGGRQEINYPDWCINQYGSVLHEMLHALGFYHQQSTYERDDYVTIMWDNIETAAVFNFAKYDADTVTEFGYEYDYGSVMHYSAYAFTNNGEMTIVTLDPAYQDVIGQRDGFGDTDLGKLKAMYNC